MIERVEPPQGWRLGRRRGSRDRARRAAGWGEPVFDKLEADLGKAMLSIPAVKGVENGDGFAGTRLTGSEHNDLFYRRATARSRRRPTAPAGSQGGISNGMPITLRVAFKPTATIIAAAVTVDRDGNAVTLEPKGRHDPCVLPRAVPIVEAMFALVLADHYLRQRAAHVTCDLGFARVAAPVARPRAPSRAGRTRSARPRRSRR